MIGLGRGQKGALHPIFARFSPFVGQNEIKTKECTQYAI
jgi:hypothetical protein